MSLPESRIPLFDIDWTLLKGGESNELHHQAFDFVLKEIYKQPQASYSDIAVQGKIDTQILIEALALNGVFEEEAKAKMPDALAGMARYFIDYADRGHYEVMPGVINLLKVLQEKQIPLGLLTGNVAEIGWEKMKRAGIKDFFSFGAFGSMAFRRVDLIEIASKEASKVLNQNIDIKDLVIIGDTPLDIACARAGGIPVIAVGAGQYKSHQLTEADLVVETLEEKDKILSFLNLT